MIKIFTTDKNGKINLTKKELEDLLNEAYWDGYNAPHYKDYTTITYPNYTPFTWNTTGTTLQYNPQYNTSESTVTNSACINNANVQNN